MDQRPLRRAFVSGRSRPNRSSTHRMISLSSMIRLNSSMTACDTHTEQEGVEKDVGVSTDVRRSLRCVFYSLSFLISESPR